MNGQNGKIYEFYGFRLIPAEHLLLRADGTNVPLMPKSYKVLLLLVEKHGHLVEKEELLKNVWAETFVEEANLARVIWTIRHALGESAQHLKFIETVPKCGYRFVAPVSEVVENQSAGELPEESAPPPAKAEKHALSKNKISALRREKEKLKFLWFYISKDWQTAVLALAIFISGILALIYFFTS